MKPLRIRRRWKVLAAGFMALLCIAVLFNIWFVQNTNTIIESLVEARSNGHIHLTLERSSFQYFRKKIVLRGATFYSSDTTGAKTSYQFNVPKLDVKLRSVSAFLLNRELLIDSIYLKSPHAIVTRLSRSEKLENNNVSVPEEVGRIYNSILDALQVLQVRRFQIDDGRFSLVNKIDSAQPITSISNIHFQINNLTIAGDSSVAQKFLYSDNIVLRVTDQNIVLPDGIHHLNFKNLLINVGRRQVQLDSCWVIAETKTDRNAFRIFFDVLKMTNLDFASLYRKNEIRADSVYINNPDIGLAFEVKQKAQRGKKLELDTIIQRFTGDLALGYIGVQNATVNIIANRGDTATTFSSKNDNFKMFGLRINSDSARPVYVDEFAMILRKYETYSRDSSILYRFDSLRFNNNKVRLSNFTLQTIAAAPGRGKLYYAIPVFELSGLSWEDLLFDRYISAEKAVLLNPEIRYTVAETKRRPTHASLFQILSGLNESIDLHAVEIQNGNLQIQLPGGKRLELQQVDVALASNRLLASRSYTGMKDAITDLSFRNAIFTTGNLRAALTGLHYSDRLHAATLQVTNKAQTMRLDARGIGMNDLIWNNLNRSVLVDHLTWDAAHLFLKASAKTAPVTTNAVVAVTNVMGRNTDVTIEAAGKTIKTKLQQFRLKEVEKKGSTPVQFVGLQAYGNNFSVQTPAYQIAGGPYQFIDNARSAFNAISFTRQNSSDTFQLAITQTFLKPHTRQWLDGKWQFDNITLSEPTLIVTRSTFQSASTSTAPWPTMDVQQLSVQDPKVRLANYQADTTMIEWLPPYTATDNAWTFEKVRLRPHSITIDTALLSGAHALLTRGTRPFGIDSGAMKLQFADISVRNSDSLTWHATLHEGLFQNPISKPLQEKSGINIAQARIANLQLSSETVQNMFKLLYASPNLQLAMQKGSLILRENQVQWNRVRYDQEVQSLYLDSLRFQPLLSRDSFILKSDKQKDFMQVLVPNLSVHRIDLQALENDSVFAARTLVLSNPTLDIYRDKRKPFVSEKLRPLPSLALQTISVKFAIDTISLRTATVNYTEMSERTQQEGTLSLSRVNSTLYPVRNFDFGERDSLTWRAEGYLMDSAWLRLQVKESYADSLGSFTVSLRARPTNLEMLNQALMPLASVKLASGHLDTISMRAVGHEYFAIGEMKMFYNNLKIQFLKGGSEQKKSFLTGLITFAANNFVIRKANSKRTAAVYFVRNRDRSIFNYLIKTTLSGVASSVGAKRSKKYYRQYKKQQKLYNLPPADLG